MNYLSVFDHFVGLELKRLSPLAEDQISEISNIKQNVIYEKSA